MKSEPLRRSVLGAVTAAGESAAAVVAAVGRALPALASTVSAASAVSAATVTPTTTSNGRARAAAMALVAALLVSACGFELRGTATYPFTSVFVQRPSTYGIGTGSTAGAAAPVVPDVIDGLVRNGVTLKAKIEDADFAIRFLQVFFDKRVLSLSGGGRAREFELEYRVRYEFVDANGRSWGEPGEITIRRDFSFTESQALAKEAEERQLVRDMQLDAAAQILRRLQAVRRPL